MKHVIDALGQLMAYTIYSAQCIHSGPANFTKAAKLSQQLRPPFGAKPRDVLKC